MMIKNIKNTLSAILLITIMLSCGENEDLLQFQEAENKISFPEFPSFFATFSSLDQVEVDVNVSGSATTLSVTGIDGDDFGTVSISNGSGTFSRSLSSLGDPDSETLAFSDGETERLLSIDISDPTSIIGTTSQVVSLDSTFSIVFEAETVNGVIDSYDLFLKIGEESAFPTIPNAEGVGTATELRDSLAFSALNTTYSIGDTIFFQVDFNSGSLTASNSGSIRITQLDLTEFGTIELRTPDFEIASGVTDSLRNAFNLKTLAYVSDETLMTSADSADVQLILNSGELDLVSGVGSGTSFVLAPGGFSSATYEAIRDAFASGTPTTIVSDIESLDDNAVILIQLGSIPEETWPSADNRRYALINIESITKTNSGVNSEAVLEYVAPAQP